MRHTTRDVMWIGGVGLVAALLLSPGCGRLRFGVTHSHDQRRESGEPAPVASTAADTEPGTVDRETVLAAVEEFLQRTEGYDAIAETPEQADPHPAYAARVPPDATRAPARAGGVRPGLAEVEAQPRTRDGAFANTLVTLSTDAPPPRTLALPTVTSVALRPVAHVIAPPVTDEAKLITNEPIGTVSPQTAVTDDQFVRHLAAQAQQTADFDSLWRLRLAQLALDRDTATPTIDADLSSDMRGILDAVIEAVTAARRVARDPMTSGDGAIRQTERLLQVLADRADPIVAAMALCRRVVTFGVYDEMADTEFVAGRGSQTIVYCEIRNFRSEQANDGSYRTVLATRLELLTDAGASVWQHEEPEIVDACRRRRSDFFIAQRVTLPPTLAAGRYVLKVLVEDKLSGKASEATHSFEVVGSGAVASRR